MSKFYVACGSQTLVVAAESAKQAAMRLIDETMAAHIWIYDDADLSEQNRRDHLVLEALLHLGSSISVSERGMGKSDAGTFGVPELLDEWHRLMVCIHLMLVTAGLESLRVLPESTISPAAPKLPR